MLILNCQKVGFADSWQFKLLVGWVLSRWLLLKWLLTEFQQVKNLVVILLTFSKSKKYLSEFICTCCSWQSARSFFKISSYLYASISTCFSSLHAFVWMLKDILLKVILLTFSKSKKYLSEFICTCCSWQSARSFFKISSYLYASISTCFSYLHAFVWMLKDQRYWYFFLLKILWQ